MSLFFIVFLGLGTVVKMSLLESWRGHLPAVRFGENYFYGSVSTSVRYLIEVNECANACDILTTILGSKAAFE